MDSGSVQCECLDTRIAAGTFLFLAAVTAWAVLFP